MNLKSEISTSCENPDFCVTPNYCLIFPCGYHSTRVVTDNNDDDNRLDHLEVLAIKLDKTITSLTSKYADNEDNNDDDMTPTSSIIRQQQQ